MSEYSDYTEYVKSFDPTQHIGMLAWYSVTGSLRIPFTTVKEVLVRTKLERHLPNMPAESDVFRRICTAAALRKVATSTQDIFDNYLIRDPGGDKSLVTRRVIREQVDAKNRRLGYQEVAEITYDRTLDLVHWKPISVDATAETICKGIMDEFKTEKGCFTGYTMRELIRRVLVGAKATNVRYPGGGVYFITADHSNVITALGMLASELPDGIYFHALPLVDDRIQRDLVKKAYEMESVERVNALITELAELSSRGTVGKERVAAYVVALQEMKAKSKEYTSLLQTSLSTATTSIALLEKQVRALLMGSRSA